jgi:PIN domain nuclease of toxin-antitoxin system
VTLLLDTQAFLWFASGDARLSRRARRAIETDDAEVWLSAASVWEMAIKARIGRLSLPSSVHAYVEQKQRAGVVIRPVEWPHAAAVESLPFHHRDPFDRLIIAQALADDMTVVTNDPAFPAYGVKTIW